MEFLSSVRIRLEADEVVHHLLLELAPLPTVDAGNPDAELEQAVHEATRREAANEGSVPQRDSPRFIFPSIQFSRK